MKNIKIITFSFFLLSLLACKKNKDHEEEIPKSIVEENITYNLGGFQMHGFLAYDKANTKPRPAVIIIHEWWGLNNYVKNRAKQLADLGYVALAIDMYGNGKVVTHPDSAQALADPLYADSMLSKNRFDAALAKIKTYAIVDPTKIAAMGYCFGGAMSLNMARMGAPLKGVISFHGNLIGVPLKKDLLQADILVCHGAADEYVNAEVAPFKKEMDDAGVQYTFKSYPNAIHSFTNPEATVIGKQFNMEIAYNAAADAAAFEDMKYFLTKIFK